MRLASSSKIAALMSRKDDETPNGVCGYISHQNNNYTEVLQMTNEQVVILMDAQDPTDSWETTLEGAREFIANQWSSWEDLDDDGELVATFTDEQIEAVSSFDYEQIEEALLGFDYRIFNNEQERKEWFEELEMEYVEE